MKFGSNWSINHLIMTKIHVIKNQNSIIIDLILINMTFRFEAIKSFFYAHLYDK